MISGKERKLRTIAIKNKRNFEWKDLAKKMGYTERHIQMQIMKDDISIKFAFKLARALGLSSPRSLLWGRRLRGYDYNVKRFSEKTLRMRRKKNVPSS